MKYFNSLPYLTTTNIDGNLYALKNLLIRTQMIPQLAKNPLLFYEYNLQDGDTPEIVANKYYGDPYRYWIVLYGNSNIMDPQADWPLSSQQFSNYLNDKYAEAAGGINNVRSYIQGTVHHYEKIVTTIDNATQTTSIKTVEIDYDTYVSIVPFSTTKTFPDRTSVVYSISTKAVSIYEYENVLNESKRNIKLINSSYATDMETQYQTLVKS